MTTGIQSAVQTLRFMVNHPLNREKRIAALFRFLKWQIGSRLVPGPVITPFVENTWLIVASGMTGATGNLYCGLHEFTDMGFVLHALRKDDLFIDVGANIGSYTVLASGCCGARSISIEPIPSSYERLCANIRLNDLGALVEAHCIGAGSESAELVFTDCMDTVNHVLARGESNLGSRPVSVRSLDWVLGPLQPTLIKIDVEGYETEVFEGATKALQSSQLLAVLMELNGSGLRYGYDETALHAKMLALGFQGCRYDPIRRSLSAVLEGESFSDNRLYVRDFEGVMARVLDAPIRQVLGRWL